MQVTVLFAEHADERDAAAVGQSLFDDPIPNVDALAVNELGLESDQRVVHTNMSGAYNNANPHSDKYEERRAHEVLAQIERDNPDIVVSLHNPGVGNVRFAVIDPRRGVTPQVLGMLYEFSIRHIIAANFGIMAHRTNAVLIEIPKAEIRADMGFVRQFIDDLANRSDLPVAEATDFEWYTHSEIRDGGLHIDDIRPDELSPEELDSITEFGRAPQIIEKRLKSAVPLYLSSGSTTANPQGFWGEVMEKIEAPNTSHWPH